MQRSFSLKKNSDFSYVFRRGRSRASRYMVVLFMPGKRLLVGFSVSKKLGGAVVRNHVKRLLRECVRPRLPAMKRGRYIIIARAPAASASLAELDASFASLLSAGQLAAQAEPSPCQKH